MTITLNAETRYKDSLASGHTHLLYMLIFKNVILSFFFEYILGFDFEFYESIFLLNVYGQIKQFYKRQMQVLMERMKC
jgi:hypothetical protein